MQHHRTPAHTGSPRIRFLIFLQLLIVTLLSGTLQVKWGTSNTIIMATIVEGFPTPLQVATDYAHLPVCVFGTVRTLHWIHFLAKKEAMPACFAGGTAPFFAAGFALLSAALGAAFFSAAGAGLSAAADAAAAAEDEI